MSHAVVDQIEDVQQKPEIFAARVQSTVCCGMWVRGAMLLAMAARSFFSSSAEEEDLPVRLTRENVELTVEALHVNFSSSLTRMSG